MRRSPVLVEYLRLQPVTDDQPVVAAIVEEDEAESTNSASPVARPTSATKPAHGTLKIDYPQVGSVCLALLTGLVSYFSIAGAVLAVAAITLQIFLLNQQQSKLRWLGFGLAVLASLCALTRLVATIFEWTTGLKLDVFLFGS
ncbi:hypothetical protein AB1L30_11555 [Bremerella sp. JC817]|uniref:hypothetical protein n=1 Tax=Bremerella sp. JC817 TaxID=3231756 RepID=UPI003457D294